MQQQKPPHPLILEKLNRDYTYNPDTGQVYKNGVAVGGKRHCGNDYYNIGFAVSVEFDEYSNLYGHLTAHQVAWYLHYGEWAMQHIDHIDGDGSNNRIANLRLATIAENMRNRGKVKRKVGKWSSQYKGVIYDKRRGQWIADITFQRKKIRVGRYPTEVDAARAYDEVAKELHGEFARLNFPPEST